MLQPKPAPIHRMDRKILLHLLQYYPIPVQTRIPTIPDGNSSLYWTSPGWILYRLFSFWETKAQTKKAPRGSLFQWNRGLTNFPVKQWGMSKQLRGICYLDLPWLTVIPVSGKEERDVCCSSLQQSCLTAYIIRILESGDNLKARLDWKDNPELKRKNPGKFCRLVIDCCIPLLCLKSVCRNMNSRLIEWKPASLKPAKQDETLEKFVLCDQIPEKKHPEGCFMF